MLKEKIGTVTGTEKEQIEKLYERKIALNELLLTLNNPNMSEELRNNLYEKVVADIGKTKVQFDKWWSDMMEKYRWKSVEGGNWEIDFKTNDIYLRQISK